MPPAYVPDAGDIPAELADIRAKIRTLIV